MPICSYLVYPEAGAAQDVQRRLADLPGCSVYPAEGHDLLMLVTDTPDEEKERALQKQLQAQPQINLLAMSFAHSEEIAT
jgi:nitrate reductase NapAB chaperone NapD